ncbi:MAG: molybdopterin-binding protein, partial [Proteobacteria bacterium]|nr:molybdopterin-binding protein [Pseudomonadota bacterium]
MKLFSAMGRSFLAHRTPAVERIERRLFLRQSLSVGALALLSGCELTDDESVQKVLTGMSAWNDGAQAWLFDPKRLA